MNLTLTLLMLAREVAAGAAPVPPTTPPRAPEADHAQAGEPATLLLELVPAGLGVEPAYLAVGVDQRTDELVIKSSTRTWDRLRAVFTDDPLATDLVRITLPEAGAAARLAARVRAANPHLVVFDDLATNSILVSAGGDPVA